MSESAAAAPTAADAAATPKPAPADLYAVLGCAKGDDAPVITRKYRKLALKYHPDRNRGDGQAEAAEKFGWNKARTVGSAVASDAFFPFRDSLDVASTRGVKYVVAAGGSVADAEGIAAADEYKMVMAFSGLRLFHH